MQSFIYRGYLIDYKIVDGKVIVSEICYDNKRIETDKFFGSLGELKRFIDAGGWSDEFHSEFADSTTVYS